MSKENFSQKSSVYSSIDNANRRRKPRVKAVSRSEGQIREVIAPGTLEEQGVSYYEELSNLFTVKGGV